MTRGRLVLVALVAMGASVVIFRSGSDEPDTFEVMPLPKGIAGDCKAVGDLDGDGLLDLVVGGKGAEEPLTWYQHGSWVARRIAVSEEEYSNDCVVADINQDGFADVVVPDATVAPNNLFWFENPGPDSILRGSAWARHPIGRTPAWCKDVRVLDLDGDGELDIVTKPLSLAPTLFFGSETGDWLRVQLDGFDAGREGLATGDVDGDGDADLIVRGAWVANPGSSDARVPESWTVHAIGEAPEDFKAFVADVDADGGQDVLFSSSEEEAPIVWWGNTPAGWVRHVVKKSALAAHTLWSADFDLDGDRDVLVGELGHRRMTLYRSLDGHGEHWQPEVIEIDQGSIHNGVVADLDGDEDLDVFGAGFTGQPLKATVWWNRVDPNSLQVGPFTAIEVTQNHERALGSTVIDLNQDGFDDIAAGHYWYRNPGGDLTGRWEQRAVPSPEGRSLDVIASLPAAGNVPGLVGMNAAGELWLLLRESTGFQERRVGRLPVADHGLSSQGVEVARPTPDGDLELFLSNGGEAATGVGIYSFRIVPDGEWPRRRITDRTSDEGFALGDIDRDGDLDVAGGRGDRGELEWYENPGTAEGDWPAHPIVTLDGVDWLDRVRLSDLSCDGRLDLIVSEENGSSRGAETYWVEQPEDLSRDPWRPHLLTSQGSTNSLDVVDIDRDGDADIVTGEHKGKLRVIVWENVRCGVFQPRPIDHGKESHLGTKANDLDRDGDLDLFSVAWDEPASIYLWRNDSVARRPPR